ncbi:MAG: hypothetical protein RML56_01280 [Burkholderiales bacterium]|nr:hypothetical protein [Burkholderiales bacterium]
MNRRALLLAVAVASIPAATAAHELGRLFFTPEQRAALDARRKAKIPEKPAPVVVEAPVTRLDGFVRREDGRSTVWVNGVPAPQEAPPEGMRFAPSRRDRLAVSVALGEGERRFELKVGERLDRESGEVRDLVDKGAIRVRRGAGP